MEDEIRRFQWMRKAEGGQAFGNKMEIRPLTEEAFQKHVFPRLRKGAGNTLMEHQAKYPNVTHYAVVWRWNDTEWQFHRDGSLEELVWPVQDSPWAIEVDSFESQQAVQYGQTADSDI